MQIKQDFDLTTYNSFAVPCTAGAFCEVRTEQDLQQALAYAAEKNLPLFILGGGSNLLFTADYPGLVAHIALPGISKSPAGNGRVELTAGAGENWHKLVMYCLNNKLYGLENLAFIPGSVGAAPIQNIGAYGVEMGAFFNRLEALDIASGKPVVLDNKACEFGYRDSVFKQSMKDKLIITSVTLNLLTEPSPRTDYAALKAELSDLPAGSMPTPKQVADAVIAIRQRKLPDPRLLSNAGSFFKNPLISQAHYERLLQDYGEVPCFPQPGNPPQVKVPAAWLLDRAGWRGKRQGNVGVHEQQALVIVNYGNATGVEVLNLARAMQDSIADKFTIQLEPEVRIV